MSRVDEVEVVEIEAAEVEPHFLPDRAEERVTVVHPAEVEDVVAVDDRGGFLADLLADAHKAGDIV